MGLLDRLKPKPVQNFADGNSITRTRSQGTAEVGVSGESIIGTFSDAEVRSDKLEVKDYVKMRQNDRAFRPTSRYQMRPTHPRMA
jgi:hypothetical protein